ncbi:protein adenylyltransferase SelO family protein, partial [Alcanivorax sp. HI0044]
LTWMQTQNADYTNTFRDLINDGQPDAEQYQNETFRQWHQQWRARLARNSKPLASSLCLMRNHNPAVIPRNHLVEQALNAASDDNDMAPTHALLQALAEPYADRDSDDPYRQSAGPGEHVFQTFCGT